MLALNLEPQPEISSSETPLLRQTEVLDDEASGGRRPCMYECAINYASNAKIDGEKEEEGESTRAQPRRPSLTLQPDKCKTGFDTSLRLHGKSVR